MIQNKFKNEFSSFLPKKKEAKRTIVGKFALEKRDRIHQLPTPS